MKTGVRLVHTVASSFMLVDHDMVIALTETNQCVRRGVKTADFFFQPSQLTSHTAIMATFAKKVNFRGLGFTVQSLSRSNEFVQPSYIYIV